MTIEPGALALATAHSEPDQPGATFRALDHALAQSPGTILFTVLVHHAAEGQNERFYTNMPDSYPVGGRKAVPNSHWTRRLFDDGLPYIGHTRDDIRDVFFDHELIWSLGCESVLNMPVRWAGRTLGTLNLLHRAGFYSEAQVPAVRVLAQLAAPALLQLTGS